MSWWPWGRRKGVHRKTMGGRQMPDEAQLRVELDAARERLAEVEAYAPAVEHSDRRARQWLFNNHIGPLFDQAFGAGK